MIMMEGNIHMTKRQLWVYNYKSKAPRMDVGGKLAPLVIPGLEILTCLLCNSEIHVLRDKARTKGQTHQMLRGFQGYYVKAPEVCECSALKVKVDTQGRLIVYTDHWDEVRMHTYDNQGLKLCLADTFDDVGYYTSPSLESYQKYEYKRPKWQMEMLTYLNMDQFTPRERLEVMPSTDADRQFFLRRYAYTYKVVIFEEGYVYLPSGHRKAQRGNPQCDPYNTRVDPKEYLDPEDNPRSYPEHLIYNLHLYSVDTLRLELEGIEDPFHMANLTLQYARPLRTP